jgi:hypothetical protein
MKTKSMTVLVARRLSDNNFGSIGAEIGVTVELEEGDDPKECRKELRKGVLAELKRALEATEEQHPVRPK